MTDVFSKYTLAVPTRDQRASTVAQVLISEWFAKLGVPARPQGFLLLTGAPPKLHPTFRAQSLKRGSFLCADPPGLLQLRIAIALCFAALPCDCFTPLFCCSMSFAAVDACV
uniref:Uncharacterized protein n=1 Tax=Knipowitschia caucasica TaxID=637954 RepID=A0AAV2IXS5_KNICA